MQGIARLYSAVKAHERLQDYDFVKEPGPAASPEALAALRDLELPPDYLAFLGHANGWVNVMPGWELLGAGALLDAQDGAKDTFDDCDTDSEVAEAALVVGRSQNDAGMLFYDRRTRAPDGRMQLVQWLYEDTARYSGIEELFASLLEEAESGIAEEERARQDLEAEWTSEWRARDEALLRETLANRLSSSSLPPAVTAERVERLALPRETPLEPGQLDTNDAKMCIALVVHTRGAPSSAEMRAIVTAFRRRFPEPAYPNVARFSWSRGRRATLVDGDPVLEEALGNPARGGTLGITVRLASDDAPPPLRFMPAAIAVTEPVLDVHVPGPFATTQSTCCIELKVPLGTDPGRVKALAHDIADLVPFTFGYASYSAVARDVSGVSRVYDWSRRCLGIDVRDARLELGALRDAVKNAAWLTLVGDPIADALSDRFGVDVLRFDSPTQVTRRNNGYLIDTASLSLGDVRGGDFTHVVSEVDRRLAPLRLQGFTNEELHSIGGIQFVATYTTYDGPFADGSATRDWLERWVEPEAHLGPTPMQKGEELLSALDAACGTSGRAAWEASKAKGHTGFDDLVHTLTVTTRDHVTTEQAIAALAWAARFACRAQGVALADLFFGLLQRGELERARPYLPLVQEAGARHAALYHNAACVAARLGEIANAIAYIREAKDRGYVGFLSMYDDDDLSTLRGRPEFEVLFARAAAHHPGQ